MRMNISLRMDFWNLIWRFCRHFEIKGHKECFCFQETSYHVQDSEFRVEKMFQLESRFLDLSHCRYSRPNWTRDLEDQQIVPIVGVCDELLWINAVDKKFLTKW